MAGFLKRLDRFLALRSSDLDRELGVKTTRTVPAKRIRTLSPRAADNVGYVATPKCVVTQVLDRVPVNGAHFLDLGCGKGAVLAVAASYPFASVRGIEFAPALAAIARRNLARLGVSAEVIEGDATSPALRVGLNIVWFYNSFFAAAQVDLIANLEQELRDGTRQLLLIYLNPVETPLWDASPALRRQLAMRVSAPSNDSGTVTDRHDLIVWASDNFPQPPEPSAAAACRVTIPGYGCEITLPETLG